MYPVLMRYSAVLVAAVLLASCSASAGENMRPVPDASPDAFMPLPDASPDAFMPLLPSCPGVGQTPPTALAMVGTTPWGDASQFTQTCVRSQGWGSCDEGDIVLDVVREGEIEAVLSIVIAFDGEMDAVETSRTCTVHRNDDGSSAPCSFVGSIEFNAGALCEETAGVNALQFRGELLADQGGFDMTSTMDVDICDMWVCI